MPNLSMLLMAESIFLDNGFRV